MNRRIFLKSAISGGMLIANGSFPVSAFDLPEIQQLTILHTNDVHSRIDPFPKGDINEGLGGVAARAQLITAIRKVKKEVLLLDSGDIFQGTPYFNYFAGELELKLMSHMKYDATTIGNHDFDAGLDGLLKQLPNCNFPFLIANYDFSDTPLAGKTKPYQVFKKGDIQVGIFGLGIELKGLVDKSLCGATQYLEPIKKGNEIARFLKREMDCDFVICLSHLGYHYDEKDRVSDLVLAKESQNIDLILGGHTHTLLNQPTVIRNMDKKEVMINQVGWGGIVLGHLDIYFEKSRKGLCINCQNSLIKG